MSFASRPNVRLTAAVAVLATAFLALPSESLAVTPAQRTWDLGADFKPSPGANPAPDRYGNAGVWRYGSEPESAPGNNFSLLPTFTQNDFYGTSTWKQPGTILLIGRQFGAAANCNPDRAATCSVAPGDVLAHPDGGRAPIARWTSPTADTVRVAGSVLDSDQFGGGQGWKLRGPTGATLASGTVGPAASSPPVPEDIDTFDVQVPVSVGGLVDLVIDSNGGDITSDTTEIAMTITRPFSDCSIANAITDNGTGDTDPAVGVITGGPGDDTLVGGAGAETLNGGGGDDELCGNGGADTLNGGAGVDGLDGGIGNDILDGGTEDDTLRGGSGDDVLLGNGGSDDLSGQAGLDRVNYSAAPGAVTITSAAGTSATGDGTGVQDLFDGSIEAVTGSPQGDSITGMRVIAGLEGDDAMTGTASDDFFAGYGGTDTYNGSSGGTDRVSHTANTAAQGATVYLNQGSVSSDGRGATTENYMGIDYVFGGPGSDYFSGNAVPAGVALWGRAGTDTLIGGAGDDIMRGEEGSTTLYCNAGNDLYTPSSGGDTFPQNDCEGTTAYSRNGSVTPIQ